MGTGANRGHHNNDDRGPVITSYSIHYTKLYDDVTTAYNPRSVLVPVARVEGLTWTVLTPGSGPGGSFLAGQGAAVTLDGSYDAVLQNSRSLFVNRNNFV